MAIAFRNGCESRGASTQEGSAPQRKKSLPVARRVVCQTTLHRHTGSAESRQGDTPRCRLRGFIGAAHTQQKRGNGDTDETEHRTQQRLRARSRAVPPRLHLFVSMLGPNDVMARSNRFSDPKPILTADCSPLELNPNHDS